MIVTKEEEAAAPASSFPRLEDLVTIGCRVQTPRDDTRISEVLAEGL